jgi:hypothetical protein
MATSRALRDEERLVTILAVSVCDAKGAAGGAGVRLVVFPADEGKAEDAGEVVDHACAELSVVSCGTLFVCERRDVLPSFDVAR